jgi:hypothetical protein
MPLLNVVVSRKITATITIECETAENLDRYAAFTKGPADSVIDEALRHIFAKDKDFQAYLADAKKRDAKPAAGLRVKKSGSPTARATASSESAESSS